MGTKQKIYRLLSNPTKPFIQGLFYIMLFLIFIGDFVIDSCLWIVKMLGKSLKIISLPHKLVPPKFIYFFYGILATLFLVFMFQSYRFVAALPRPSQIGTINYPVSTKITDRNDNLLFEIYHDQNRTPVAIKDLPKYVTQATIAVEDKDFYSHQGISPIGGVVRAMKETITEKKLQGGSTITQQLVKTALLTPERTIERKMKEAILALWTEQTYSKDRILEMYLNQVAYGGSSYGIQEASRTYFGKDAKKLSIAQAAFLAGLPQAPSVYSPYVNPDLALRRRNEVLKRMYAQKFINKASYDQAVKSPIDVQPNTHFIRAPHFVFYVKSLLEKEYGIRMVEEGGLTVKTTLSLATQEKTEKILADEVARIGYLNVSNGAALVTAPQTGDVLAMVGSVDYYKEPFGAFNVTTALRQPGSSIKPLMYALALEREFTAATLLDDSPASFAQPGAAPYVPVNYDGRFHGKVPLRLALANSYNLTAVKTLNALGVNNFIDHAQDMGISTWTDRSRFGLSLTLGGGEVTMTDMATAFGVFANGGKRVDLDPVLSIHDYTGKKIYEKNSERSVFQAIPETVAYIISDILSDNVARQSAFGARSSLEIPGKKVAVKTGTTNDKRDNWTVGYNPQYVTTVWVGNNNNAPMNPLLTSGITGAAPIFNRVMSMILTDNPLQFSSQTENFAQPVDIVRRDCFYKKGEVFISGTENKVNCMQSGLSPTPTLRRMN